MRGCAVARDAGRWRRLPGGRPGGSTSSRSARRPGPAVVRAADGRRLGLRARPAAGVALVDDPMPAVRAGARGAGPRDGAALAPAARAAAIRALDDETVRVRAAAAGRAGGRRRSDRRRSCSRSSSTGCASRPRRRRSTPWPVARDAVGQDPVDPADQSSTFASRSRRARRRSRRDRRHSAPMAARRRTTRGVPRATCSRYRERDLVRAGARGAGRARRPGGVRAHPALPRGMRTRMSAPRRIEALESIGDRRLAARRRPPDRGRRAGPTTATGRRSLERLRDDDDPWLRRLAQTCRGDAT